MTGTNSATATGTPPVTSGPSTASVPAVVPPVITLVKSAVPASYAAAGQLITFSYLVTNTSRVTLADIAVNDTLPGVTSVRCPQPTLPPGGSQTCTATYQTTATDLDVGSITNVATAQGNPPGSATPVISDPGRGTVPAVQQPAITIRKSAQPATFGKVGQVISYSYLVTNTGNVTLTGITVHEGLPGLSAVTCPQATLAAGDSETCTASYTVTTADVAAGSIINTATAQGFPPDTTDVPVTSGPSTVIVPREDLGVPRTGARRQAGGIPRVSLAGNQVSGGNVLLLSVTMISRGVTQGRWLRDPGLSRRRRAGAAAAAALLALAAVAGAQSRAAGQAMGAAAAGAVIHVAPGGHDTAGCGSAAGPCQTIPYAYGRAAGGDTIQVAAGTYTLTGTLTIAKPGIRLLGAMAGVNAATRAPGGPGETVITGTGAPPSDGLFTAAADDVTINGFTFKGNLAGGGLATSEHFSGYVVEDNIVTGNVTGLYAESDGSKPSVYRDNFFVANNDSGPNSGNGVFTFRPLANAAFTGNKFRDNNNAPVNIAGNDVPGGSHDIVIADNDMNGEFGVTLVGVSRVLITRNKMTGGWNAVQVSGACHDITITRNIMNDKTRGGVLLFTGFKEVTNTGITIEGNIINHTATVAGRYGIEISRSTGVVIRRNLLKGSGHGAIGFTARGQDVPSQAAVIEQNTITGSGGPGITVAPGTYTGPMAVHYNRIVDNDPHRGILTDDPAAVIDAALNWWGCNHMPGGAGCDHPAGTSQALVSFSPWLVLRIASSPADILAGQGADILADLHHDSAGTLTAGPFFAPVTAVFSATRGHVSLAGVLTNALLHARTGWPAGQPRPEQICVRVDHQVECLVFPPVGPPVVEPEVPGQRPELEVEPEVPVTG